MTIICLLPNVGRQPPVPNASRPLRYRRAARTSLPEHFTKRTNRTAATNNKGNSFEDQSLSPEHSERTVPARSRSGDGIFARTGQRTARTGSSALVESVRRQTTGGAPREALFHVSAQIAHGEIQFKL